MRHTYKRGRTQCDNRSYKTGFSPCELAYDREKKDLLDMIAGAAGWHPRKRPSAEDIQAAADITGLSNCSVADAQKRVEEKRQLRMALAAMGPNSVAATAGVVGGSATDVIIHARNLGVISDEEAIARITGDYWVSLKDAKAQL